MDWVKRADYATFRFINERMHSPILDPISTVLSYSGLGISLVLFALALLFFRSTRSWTLPILATLLLSGAIIADLLFKVLLPRDRPSNLPYAIREESHLIGSFPSGHSCVSFGTAFTILLLTWRTPQQKWGGLALAWAACVGLSRIYRGVHWPTDVLAGACVGLFSACVVVGATQLVMGGETPQKEGSRKGSSSKSKKRRTKAKASSR